MAALRVWADEVMSMPAAELGSPAGGHTLPQAPCPISQAWGGDLLVVQRVILGSEGSFWNDTGLQPSLSTSQPVTSGSC